MKKLPKLRKTSGSFVGTNGMGHDMYDADFYSDRDVERYKKAAKKIYRELKEYRAKHGPLTKEYKE